MSHPEALQQKVEAVKGVTPARLAQLRRLGIETVGDLLWHFPRGYDEFTGLKKIDDLAEEQIQTVRGEVVEIDGKHTSTGRQIVSIVLSDGGRHCKWVKRCGQAATTRSGSDSSVRRYGLVRSCGVRVVSSIEHVRSRTRVTTCLAVARASSAPRHR